VGHADLAATPEVHGVEEPVDALGDEVRVVHGERPAQARRLDAPEELAALLEVVGEVADLGVLRLPVEVLQEQPCARSLGVGGRPPRSTPIRSRSVMVRRPYYDFAPSARGRAAPSSARSAPTMGRRGDAYEGTSCGRR